MSTFLIAIFCFIAVYAAMVAIYATTGGNGHGRTK